MRDQSGVLMLVALALFTAHAAEPVLGSSASAKVSITVPMVEAAFGPLSESNPDDLEAMVRNVAIAELLVKKAKAQKLAKDRDWALKLEMAQKEATARVMLEFLTSAEVTDASVEEAWKKDNRFQTVQLRARHILVSDDETLALVQAKLEEGVSFAEVAGEYSEDTRSGADGGNLGWFSKEEMVKPFADAAFAAEVGELFGPVETRFGKHMIEVLERRDGVPLEDVAPRLREKLEGAAVDAIVDQLSEELEPFTFTAPE